MVGDDGKGGWRGVDSFDAAEVTVFGRHGGSGCAYIGVLAKEW